MKSHNTWIKGLKNLYSIEYPLNLYIKLAVINFSEKGVSAVTSIQQGRKHFQPIKQANKQKTKQTKQYRSHCKLAINYIIFSGKRKSRYNIEYQCKLFQKQKYRLGSLWLLYSILFRLWFSSSGSHKELKNKNQVFFPQELFLRIPHMYLCWWVNIQGSWHVENMSCMKN